MQRNIIYYIDNVSQSFATEVRISACSSRVPIASNLARLVADADADACTTTSYNTYRGNTWTYLRVSSMILLSIYIENILSARGTDIAWYGQRRLNHLIYGDFTRSRQRPANQSPVESTCVQPVFITIPSTDNDVAKCRVVLGALGSVSVLCCRHQFVCLRRTGSKLVSRNKEGI